MGKKLTIAEQWETYRRDVLPANAPPVQVRECRIAFYGGATALYMSIMAALDPGKEPTEGDLKYMAAIDAELKAFRP